MRVLFLSTNAPFRETLGYTSFIQRALHAPMLLGHEFNIDAPLQKTATQTRSAVRRPYTRPFELYLPDPVLAVVFMACRPPVDPIVLVMRHLKNVEMTGITRTR